MLPESLFLTGEEYDALSTEEQKALWRDYRAERRRKAVEEYRWQNGESTLRSEPRSTGPWQPSRVPWRARCTVRARSLPGWRDILHGWPGLRAGELEALAWEAAGQQSSAGVQFLKPDMPSPARLLHTPCRAWLLFAPGDGEQNACMDGIIPGALEQDGPSLAPASAGRTPTGEARSKLAKYAGIMIRRRGGKHA